MQRSTHAAAAPHSTQHSLHTVAHVLGRHPQVSALTRFKAPAQEFVQVEHTGCCVQPVVGQQLGPQRDEGGGGKQHAGRVADTQPERTREGEYSVTEELQTLHTLCQRQKFGGRCVCESVVEVPGGSIEQAPYAQSRHSFLCAFSPGPTQMRSAPHDGRPVQRCV